MGLSDASHRPGYQHLCGIQANRNLKRQGLPIPTNDLWIAASCMEHGAVLFSFDAHFERVGGLRLIRQWAEALP